MSISTPSKGPAPTHRLLYRGSLSLQDSYLPLDGLSFTAKISDMHNSPALLNNPLALTLESMRGRPSLRFLGMTKLSDVFLDVSGDVTLWAINLELIQFTDERKVYTSTCSLEPYIF